MKLPNIKNMLILARGTLAICSLNLFIKAVFIVWAGGDMTFAIFLVLSAIYLYQFAKPQSGLVLSLDMSKFFNLIERK